MIRRPTSAIINTRALEHNYLELKKRLEPPARMMAVVKANAYGHGDAQVAALLEGLGCEFFGVAIPEEGARLREAGIKSPVIVLGGVFPEQVEELFNFNLTPVIYDMESALLIDSIAEKRGTEKNVHLKIDTGMGRLGIVPGKLKAFLEGLGALKNLRLEGVLSHFAEAGSMKNDFSARQARDFMEAVENIRGSGFTPELIHMANSAAIVEMPDTVFNLARPGIMLYGSYPSPRLESKIGLKPVMEIKTRVLQLKPVPAGTTISYGRTFVTKRRSTIATLPVGYGDGLPRSLSGAGEVLVNGRRVPLVGLICMDLSMCDVTDVEGVETGSEVIVMGSQGAETITAEEIAEKAGTISYEIFCNISDRVPRIYQ